MKFLLASICCFLVACNSDDDATVPSSIDLKADAITYEMVSQSSATTGEVRIRGHVKNVGNTTFSSTEGQQIAYLIERPQGTTTETVLATANLPTVLNSGSEITFSYTRNWDVATEFQNDIILRISYDPDIFLDGNPNNDDKNTNNNSLVLAGNAINSLF
ncbi:hypothetical protein [Flavobacterium sp. J27]|uniref:hypothetical protein n=1 Tax=Flavobacterium sp. J27 TaxID=2060419 RepID=UPI0013EEB7EE|nr:hypothetical protein [Flavobacterium sp. J27]